MTIQNDEHFDLDGFSESQLLDEKQTAVAVKLKQGTLAVWRCTGRVALPYIKVGRSVRYRVGDIRDFLQKRTRLHTGEC
jgi:hypothetical protein